MAQRIEQIGRRLKEAREAASMSQADLGKVLSVTQSAISLYERGRGMTIDQLFAASDALGVSVASLLGLPTSLSEDEDALLAAYRALPNDEIRRICLGLIRSLPRK